MTTLCRDCAALEPAAADEPHSDRCGSCGSPRLVRHEELSDLAIAHIDCDAFYAAVEKRDRPDLADRPVIVGGGARGVVLACCYVARLYGVRSAMPMFKAMEACPHAVVIRPDMTKYREVGRAVRSEMRQLTPLVEPLSIDEAFLDLSASPVLHGATPAQLLAALARRVETTFGVTVSIGLSCNKFLAKIASDLDKPRGFAVIGRAEAPSFLAERPVSLLWGVGTATQRRLAADGITRIGQLRAVPERDLAARYGRMGLRMAQLARAEDDRPVIAAGQARSISAETTFARDEASFEALAQALRPLCDRISERLKLSSLAAGTVTLKLKSSDFRLRTRSRRLADPSQQCETLLATARHLLAGEVDGIARFRLIGVGVGSLVASSAGDTPTLFESRPDGAAASERELVAHETATCALPSETG
ncbi:MAG: DNA polymerase IV [Alphaproteobacteria bacterium]|nr:DNA polymerase IV [Alphaproteobacteria bacterium]